MGSQMTEPIIEKLPHRFGGSEHLVMVGDQVFGVVSPMAPQTDLKRRKWWRARVGNMEVGLFSGKNGRLVAIHAVLDFWRTAKRNKELMHADG